MYEGLAHGPNILYFSTLGNIKLTWWRNRSDNRLVLSGTVDKQGLLRNVDRDAT